MCVNLTGLLGDVIAIRIKTETNTQMGLRQEAMNDRSVGNKNWAHRLKKRKAPKARDVKAWASGPGFRHQDSGALKARNHLNPQTNLRHGSGVRRSHKVKKTIPSITAFAIDSEVPHCEMHFHS